MDYYTNYIKSHVDWELAGMYSDEGVTGTSMKKREGFTHMVQDAPDGKIQLIVTKSVSRFARNTVDKPHNDTETQGTWSRGLFRYAAKSS